MPLVQDIQPGVKLPCVVDLLHWSAREHQTESGQLWQQRTWRLLKAGNLLQCSASPSLSASADAFLTHIQTS